MRNILILSAGAIILACESPEQKNTEQSYQQWHSDYMNARQSDDISDLCDEYFQDCVDAGYPEDACGIRLEECEEYYENGGDREEVSEDEREDNSACEEEAQEAFDDCVEEGGSSEDCRLVYAQTYDECVGEE